VRHDVDRTGSWVMLFSHGCPTGGTASKPCGRKLDLAGSLSKSESLDWLDWGLKAISAAVTGRGRADRTE
jgi:hypothetical protein